MNWASSSEARWRKGPIKNYRIFIIAKGTFVLWLSNLVSQISLFDFPLYVVSCSVVWLAHCHTNFNLINWILDGIAQTYVVGFCFVFLINKCWCIYQDFWHNKKHVLPKKIGNITRNSLTSIFYCHNLNLMNNLMFPCWLLLARLTSLFLSAISPRLRYMCFIPSPSPVQLVIHFFWSHNGINKVGLGML